MKKIFCHVLLFDTPKSQALRCVESALAQEQDGLEIVCAVSDNGGGSQETLHACAEIPGCLVWSNEYNFGFCGGHNIAALRARRWGADFLVVLNPDVVLTPGALAAMVLSFDRDPAIGMVTPKLLRSDNEGRPMIPPTIDAAGMHLTCAFRHFDRGSDQVDSGQFDQGAFVFGGTGACLMLSQQAISRLELHVGDSESDTLKVHPEMKYAPERLFLFDEGFFAYREDAELSFRAQCLGIKVWYESTAVVLHVRKQRGAGRAHEVVNSLSVKNRFLLGALYSSWSNILVKLCTMLRDCIVVAGVYLFERSSLPALSNAKLLLCRASLRRKELARRNPQGLQSLNRWFCKEYE